MADRDKWHRWLRDVRHGGDVSCQDQMLADFLHPVREAVLSRAALQPGETLLDVGTGDGLIGLGALDQLGPAGHVIFSDVSQDLLDHCRRVATSKGVAGRCTFLRASADCLTGIADASVDVITTRSVLIYVRDKAAALAEFYRVLRPGGRISLMEPINRLMPMLDSHRFLGYDTRAVATLAAKVAVLFESIQPPASDPMLNFDERDLLQHAEAAGFPEIRLDLQVTVKATTTPCPWETFLRRSGNPLLPPLGDLLARALTAEELATFVAVLRPQAESGTGQERLALAYLTAIKS